MILRIVVGSVVEVNEHPWQVKLTACCEFSVYVFTVKM